MKWDLYVVKTFKLPSYILFVINSLYRKHTPWFRGTFAALCTLHNSCNHIIYRLPDTSSIPVQLETYFLFFKQFQYIYLQMHFIDTLYGIEEHA